MRRATATSMLDRMARIRAGADPRDIQGFKAVMDSIAAATEAGKETHR